MQQLSDLQKEDPAKFKLVVEQISQKFGQLASSQTGAEQDGLSRLSQAFKKAADTGDLSALRPEGKRSHGPAQPQGEAGQTARVAEMYRKNGPPPPARETLETAFTQALAVVSAASGQQPSSSLSQQQAALSNVQAA